MVIRANAKINLMLDILGQTDDGYHSLFMIMQSIGLYDYITVDLTGNKNEIELSCSNEALPCDEHNIAYKAAMAFFNYAKIKNPGIKIHIEKNIPFAAGLAGGSADAAAVIAALNEILELHLSVDELCAIGVKVGADVPFCLKGGTMVALDIGQVLAPLTPIKDQYIVLVKPNQDVSTKAAYDAFDTAENIRHCDRKGIIHAIEKGDDEYFYQSIKNVFEQFVEVPDRVDIKSVMREFGCKACCMSGSGPSVYALFDNEIKARSCAEKLSKTWSDTFVIHPARSGLEFID